MSEIGHPKRSQLIERYKDQELVQSGETSLLKNYTNANMEDRSFESNVQEVLQANVSSEKPEMATTTLSVSKEYQAKGKAG